MIITRLAPTSTAYSVCGLLLVRLVQQPAQPVLLCPALAAKGQPGDPDTRQCVLLISRSAGNA